MTEALWLWKFRDPDRGDKRVTPVPPQYVTPSKTRMPGAALLFRQSFDAIGRGSFRAILVLRLQKAIDIPDCSLSLPSRHHHSATMFDLPAHLSTLNTIASPPSVGISRENDEPFWDFIHTDQLFDNFSAVSPEASKAESQPIRASAPDQSQPELAFEQAQRRPQLPAATLESIIAAFANETTTNNRLSIPLPLPYNSGASSSSLTPAPAIDTASVPPRLDIAVSPDGRCGRVSPASREVG